VTSSRLGMSIWLCSSLQAEPVSECGLRPHPISTTIIGIPQNLQVGEGLHWADTKRGSPSMELLPAYLRAEESFVNKAVNDIGYRLPYWRTHYHNGAGDLDVVPEIIIEDRGPRIWNVSSARNCWTTDRQIVIARS
jgi:hypothetical protein